MAGLTRRDALEALGGVAGLGILGSAVGSRGGDTADTAAAPGQNRESHFLATWSASPQPTPPQEVTEYPVRTFENETLRLMARTSVGGQGVRIRLTNAYGDQPRTFDRASLGIRSSGPDIEPSTLREVTFGGEPSVTIPPGGRVISDPVHLHIEAEQDLAINLYTESATAGQTWHRLPTKTSYIAGGDVTDQAGGTVFDRSMVQWYFLEGVEVLTPDTRGAIVCLGDSITDGFASTIDANAAYPDFLAERVNDRQGLRKSVINAGISGNRVLNDSPLFGENALARFDRDVLTQTGVTDLILLEGINDIGFEQLDGRAFQPATSVTADDIIAGYKQLIRRAHAQGVRVIGGTLTPFKGAAYFYEEGEKKRQAVNEFIRTSGAFDGVVDFDKAIRDPRDPTRIRPAYDSGDNLHPNDAGYRAMAEAVDLRLVHGHGQSSQSKASERSRGASST